MPPVSRTRRDAIAVVTIDSPPVNALSHAVREGLLDCIDSAEADDSVRAVVVLCAGRTFIAGADIREFDRPPEKPLLPDLVNRIEACSKPVLAAMHGTAFGGGLEIAMGCHYRLATATALLGLPEVKLGLLSGATGTQRLPRLVGVQNALDMMLSGDPIAAAVALERGLVDKVVEAEARLEGAAVAFAAELESRGPRRVRDLEVSAVDPQLFEAARAELARKARGLLSPVRIVRCVEIATETDFDSGCEAERRFFLECKKSPQSDGLRHAFFAERAAGKMAGGAAEARPRGIESVAVIGAGTMGAGIAYSCLAAGFYVQLLDKDQGGLERGRTAIHKLFEGGVARGKLAERDMQDALKRFSTAQDLAETGSADLVIEAVFENLSIKNEVFASLDSICKPGAILATNTSTLNIDKIAAATERPQDVVGLHFFSPAHIMRLLEIVRGRETSDEVVATALRLAKTLKKTGVVVGNCFGFVGNRMLYSYGRESQLLLLEGAAPEYIDSVLHDWGMAMGPNAVGDLAGLDVGYRIRQERSDLPDDPRFYRVADLLAEQGRYGQKTGRGMYRYEKGSRTPLPDPEVEALIREEAQRLGVEQREIGEQEIIERCIYALVTEGARILEEGIAQRSSDVDVIWINGYGFPRHRGGPMHFADSVGVDEVLRKVLAFEERFGPMYWRPPALMRQLAESGGRFGEIGR